MTNMWCPVCKTIVETTVTEDSLSTFPQKGESVRCKTCNAEIFTDCYNQKQYLRKQRKYKLLKGLKFVLKIVNSMIVGPVVCLLGAALMLFSLLYLMSLLSG